MSNESPVVLARQKADSEALYRATGNRALTLDPRRLLAELVPLGDLVICILTSVLVHQIYNFYALGYFPDLTQGLVVGCVLGVLTIIFGFDRNLYTFQHLIQSQVKDLIRVWLNVAFATITLAFLFKTSADLSRAAVILTFSIGFVGLVGYRQFIRFLVFYFGQTNDALQSRIAVVGATQSARDFIGQVLQVNDEKKDLLKLIGIYDDRAKMRTDELEFKISGTLDDLLEHAKNGRIDQIVVALPWMAVDRLEQIVEKLSIVPVPVRLCPEGIAYSWNTLSSDRLGNVETIDVRSRSIDGVEGALKFVMDRVGAACLILMLMPVFLLIALAIKMDTKGPVFFRQRRHGFNHESFQVWKFRSMSVMEDGDEIKQASKNDDRITRVGKFLRKTSLDELPQLYNVLIGNMSLVGPRPHALAHNDKYSKMLRGYARRHNVIPGITGLAQVKGFRGETDTLDKMEKRLQYDLEYIDNWSLVLDIKILFRTVGALCFPKNSY